VKASGEGEDNDVFGLESCEIEASGEESDGGLFIFCLNLSEFIRVFTCTYIYSL
jgi:hypothetical protein